MNTTTNHLTVVVTRDDLTVECDRCHHVARYVTTPTNPEAPTTYACARHAYPLTDFTHLPR